VRLRWGAQGKHAEALELYERSLDMRERTLGIWHPDVQASLGNLAALMRSRCVRSHSAYTSCFGVYRARVLQWKGFAIVPNYGQGAGHAGLAPETECSTRVTSATGLFHSRTHFSLLTGRESAGAS
jgi:hypothetical protein